MHFAKNITIDDALIKQKKKLMRQVKYNIGNPSVFLVYENHLTNKIEFMHSFYFKQKYFKTLPIEIIAMYKKYDGALSYLVNDTVNKLGVVLDDDSKDE